MFGRAAWIPIAIQKVARQVRRFWHDRQATWRKPGPTRQQGCDALRVRGLFLAEAFDDDELPMQPLPVSAQAKKHR
ncbi:hypothetical protein GmRootV35_53770 [Variovorax sp. V35]